MMFAYGLISTTNALIVRVAIRCSVIFVFPFIWCHELFSQDLTEARRFRRRAAIYSSLNLTGAQVAYLERNNLSSAFILFSLLIICIFFYCVHVASYKFWTSLVFSTAFSGSVQDAYYLYANWTELVAFMFIRTRSSLKYAPKFITIMNLSFLFYVNSYMYPAATESLLTLNLLTIVFYLYFIVHYEYRALTEWNPCGSYTPSETNPRCAYHHVLASLDYMYSFDLFSMFQPLRFIETFPNASQEAFQRIQLEELSTGISFSPVPRNARAALAAEAA